MQDSLSPNVETGRMGRLVATGCGIASLLVAPPTVTSARAGETASATPGKRGGLFPKLLSKAKNRILPFTSFPKKKARDSQAVGP